MALNEEQVGKVQLLLASSGWNEVMRPLIAQRGRHALDALVLSPAERKGEFKDVPDDVLRARIQECEWMLAAWGNEVAVFNHNRRLEELEVNGGEPTGR